jgi:hypothetical protein
MIDVTSRRPKRRSYRALTASEATNEQSDTTYNVTFIVSASLQQHNKAKKSETIPVTGGGGL